MRFQPFLSYEPARCGAGQHPDREEVADKAEDDEAHGDVGDHDAPGISDLLIGHGATVTVSLTLESCLARFLNCVQIT